MKIRVAIAQQSIARFRPDARFSSFLSVIPKSVPNQAMLKDTEIQLVSFFSNYDARDVIVMLSRRVDEQLRALRELPDDSDRLQLRLIHDCDRCSCVIRTANA